MQSLQSFFLQVASPALATQRSQPPSSPAGFATPAAAPQLFPTRSAGGVGFSPTLSGWDDFGASPAPGLLFAHRPDAGAQLGAGPTLHTPVASTAAPEQPQLPPGIGGTPGTVRFGPC